MAERPTPYSIVLCELIRQSCDPESDWNAQWRLLASKGRKDRRSVQAETEEEPNIQDSDSVTSLTPLENVVRSLVVVGGDSLLSREHSSCASSLDSILSKVTTECETVVPAEDGVLLKRVLVRPLEEMASSMDALMDFMDVTIPSLLRHESDKKEDNSVKNNNGDGILDATGLYGVYLRRQAMGFDDLSWEATCRLWEAYQSFLRPHDDAAVDKKTTLQEPWPPSFAQMERRVQQDIRDFSQHHNDNANDKNDSFEAVEVELRQWLQREPELPALHFLRFLNCWRSKERTEAMESLHRYFDYAVIYERKHLAVATTMLLSNSSSSTSQQQQRLQQQQQQQRLAAATAARDGAGSILQYAAILLAALYHDFGHFEMSQMATEEAIRVAQQSGDGVCVAYALGWLHYNAAAASSSRDVGASSLASTILARRQAEEELLRRCAIRASDHGLVHLSAGASLAMAQHSALSPPSMGAASISQTPTTAPMGLATVTSLPLPAMSWDRLAGATTGAAARTSDGSAAAGVGGAAAVAAANAAASGGGGASAAQSASSTDRDAPVFLSNATDGQDTLCTVARQHLVSSGLWDAFGNSPLSSLFARIALQKTETSKKRLSEEEFAIASQRIAQSVLHGNFENDASLSEKSVYQSALAELRDLKLQYRTSHRSGGGASQVWAHSTLLLEHEEAIRGMKLQDAKALRCYLYSTLSPGDGQSTETWLQVASQYSLSLCASGQDPEKARQVCRSLCRVCRQEGLYFHQGRFLLQLALVQLQTSTSRAFQLLCLPDLLDCLALTERRGMDALHACARILLARLWVEAMNDAAAARAHVRAVLPTLLQHGPLWFQGEAWLVLAKCTLHDAKKVAQGRRRRWTCATRQLGKAASLFGRVQDVVRLQQVHYLESHTFHFLQRTSDRNAAAARFRDLSKRIASSTTPAWPREGLVWTTAAA